MTDNSNNSNNLNENPNFQDNSPQFSDSSIYSENIGKILRDARIQQKIDIKTITQATKISARQVEYIETQQWDKLPEKMVILGFVKNYARLLKLDADSLVQKLANYHNLDKPVVLEIDKGVNFEKTPSLKNFSHEMGYTSSKKTFVVIAVIVLLIVAVGLLATFTNLVNIENFYPSDNKVSEEVISEQDSNNSSIDQSQNPNDPNSTQNAQEVPPMSESINSSNTISSETATPQQQTQPANPYQ